MRLRNYYASACSSFLLLTVSCFSQQSKLEEYTSSSSARKFEDKKEDNKEDVGHGAYSVRGDGEVLLFPEPGDSGFEEPMGDSVPSPKTDRCSSGTMLFEDTCVDKMQVSLILDQRGQETRDKMYKAHEPYQIVDVSHDLIEQQILQMSKTEDDLDEILEQLQRENLEKTVSVEQFEEKGGKL